MYPIFHVLRRSTELALLACFLGPVGYGAAQQIDVTSATIEDVNRALDEGTLTSERLVELYLARMEAFDQAGPTLNAVLTVNPRARERARELDAERRERGPRSPLHGIPVVLKDNLDTADMPTTAGSSLLQGSVPPDDAFIVRKLRDAGAIVLAKLNMSEFASGGPQSSLGGPMRNPHDLTRSPAGSSGGTGIAIASAYAQFGLGTDTADDATRKSEGRFESDYTQFLDADALSGARIGIAREVMHAEA